MPAITSTKLLPIDDPTIDIFEAQKLMQVCLKFFKIFYLFVLATFG